MSPFLKHSHLRDRKTTLNLLTIRITNLLCKDGNLPCSCLQSFHPSSLSDDCWKHDGMGWAQNVQNVLPPLARWLPLSILMTPTKCHKTRKMLPLTKRLSQKGSEKGYHWILLVSAPILSNHFLHLSAFWRGQPLPWKKHPK